MLPRLIIDEVVQFCFFSFFFNSGELRKEGPPTLGLIFNKPSRLFQFQFMCAPYKMQKVSLFSCLDFPNPESIQEHLLAFSAGCFHCGIV